ncbi:MAG: bifunctional diaminohydroxyphosphoribosylaminopyrimidine deaminase/5-amino-6-(5-phosphoribosylamino)uracil reductase RibD [Bdellovibrionales bacterium]
MKQGFVAGGLFQDCLPFSLKESVPKHGIYSTLEEERMAVAFRASMNSVGICNPNPAVGAAIYKNRQLVATGFTQSYGQKHAERMAIESALAQGVELKNCELYVTLEPCSHQGKQPPCADLVASIPWHRIVVGSIDPNPLVKGQGFKKIQDALKTTAVQLGNFSEEITAWNYPFFASQKLQRPVIVAKWAQTQDGKLARSDGSSRWISGPASRAYTHWLRQKYDVIAVGLNTLLMDRPQLTIRDCGEPRQNQPLRLVLDLKGRLIDQVEVLEAHELLKNVEAVLVQKERAKDLRRYFQEAEVKVEVIESQSKTLSALQETSVIQMLGQLRGRPVSSYFVEGGAQTLSLLFQENLVDLAHVFISPENWEESPYTIQDSPVINLNLKSDWRSLQSAKIQRENPDEVDQLLEFLPKSLYQQIF